MKKLLKFVLLVALLAVVYWGLAEADIVPSYRCGTALDPSGFVEVCYWDTTDRLF